MGYIRKQRGERDAVIAAIQCLETELREKDAQSARDLVSLKAELEGKLQEVEGKLQRTCDSV